ncbi:hypothetical protein D3C75_323350 [compost metagenome]
MNPGWRIMASAAGIGNLRPRHLNMLVLGMVHEHGASWHPVADHRPCSNDPVTVVYFQPVIIGNVMGCRIVIVDPYRRASAEQGQHMLVILVGGVNIPFTVRCQISQHQ